MKCRRDAVTQKLEQACLMCAVYPQEPKQAWCSRKCGQAAVGKAPIILHLPPTNPKFADIQKQFTATWQNGTAPTVQHIFKVVNSTQTENAFQAYRQTVEAACNFVAQKKSAGNENRRWHGTVRQCKLGDTPTSTTLCTAAGCRLCGIIRTSFKTSASVSEPGIFSSGFSSISHGYTRAATPGSPYRAMLLTRVIVGKETVTPGPPAGYHSVVRSYDSSGKHSELIVYRNDAICSSWLVVYG